VVKVRKAAVVWIVAAAVIGALSIFALRPSNPLLRNREYVEAQGFEANEHSKQRYRYFIKASFSDLKSDIEDIGWGRSSSTDLGDFYSWGSYDSGEAFAIYEGKIDLPDYPYMGDPVPVEDQDPGWCTLVYRPPERPLGFTEFVMRLMR
jgi:hypothetical protein